MSSQFVNDFMSTQFLSDFLLQFFSSSILKKEKLRHFTQALGLG